MMFIVNFTLCLVFTYLRSTESHAIYLASTYCSTLLNVNTPLMGNYPIQSTANSISIRRGSTTLSSGSTYVSGETLTVSIATTSGYEYIYQTSAGSFTSGGCNNLRIANTATASLTMPSSGDVTIAFAWSPGYGQAHIGTSVTLTGPTTNSPSPSSEPTIIPTVLPTKKPSKLPTVSPTFGPTESPSILPTTLNPTISPTSCPSVYPSDQPSVNPTLPPSIVPTVFPSILPTNLPTLYNVGSPTCHPTISLSPTANPTAVPTFSPSLFPSFFPTMQPSNSPSGTPTQHPVQSPTKFPTPIPTPSPSIFPTTNPSDFPTYSPTDEPTSVNFLSPSPMPTSNPSILNGINLMAFHTYPKSEKEDIIIGLLFGIGGFVATLLSLQIYLIKYRGNTFTEISNQTKSLVSAATAMSLGVAVIILVAFWCRDNNYQFGYLGFPSWSKDVLSFHVLFMVGGFFVAQVFAICIWIFFQNNHTVGKLFHALFHSIAISSLFTGLAAIVKYKWDQRSPSLTTLHSWFGIMAIALYSTNYLFGFFMAFVSHFFPDSILVKAISLKSNHQKIGLTALIFTILSIVTGIMAQLGLGSCYYTNTYGYIYEADKNPAENYYLIPDACKIANGIGIITFFIGLFVCFTVYFKSKLNEDITIKNKFYRIPRSSVVPNGEMVASL